MSFSRKFRVKSVLHFAKIHLCKNASLKLCTCIWGVLLIVKRLQITMSLPASYGTVLGNEVSCRRTCEVLQVKRLRPLYYSTLSQIPKSCLKWSKIPLGLKNIYKRIFGIVMLMLLDFPLRIASNKNTLPTPVWYKNNKVTWRPSYRALFADKNMHCKD